MRKKYIVIIVLLIVLLNLKPKNVSAWYDTYNYSNYYGIGHSMKKGERYTIQEMQNMIYIDKNNNFVLANFLSNNIYDGEYTETVIIKYDDDQSDYTNKEECESNDYSGKICNQDSYTYSETRYNGTKYSRIGEPVTQTITDLPCLTDTNNKCKVESIIRNENYKNIDSYQYIGDVQNPQLLYHAFNFTEEEKNQINKFVSEYFLRKEPTAYEEANHFAVYKEDGATDVTLKLDNISKNEVGNAQLVSSDPQKIDYIIFTINNNTASVKNINVSDDWKLKTFEDKTEKYDDNDDEWKTITQTFYSLKNKNASSKSEIASIQLEGKTNINNDTIVISEYQQIEKMMAFVKDGEEYIDYGSGWDDYYNGAGCDTPYQNKNLGTSFFQITNDLYYYPDYCKTSDIDDVEYKKYTASLTTINVLPNKPTIEYSKVRTKTPNENPKTGNNFIVMLVSLGIIVIMMLFSRLFNKEDIKQYEK